jgi:exopolysaccharide biosynthesis polyprenyl glycosylphosphotransferase
MATFQVWQRESTSDTAVGSKVSGVARRAHHTRSRFRLWIFLDILTVIVSASIATVIEKHVGLLTGAETFYHGTLFYARNKEILLALLVGFTIVLVLVSSRHNLYQPTAITSFLHEQRMSAQSCITAGLLLTGVLYMVRTADVPRHIIVLTVALVLVLLAVRRGVYRILLYRRFDRGVDMRNTLIVGSSPEARALQHHLQSIPHLGYHVKGVVPPSELEVRVVSERDNVDSIDLLFQRARAEFIDEIIFATQFDHELMQDILERARIYGVDLRLAPDFYAGIPGIYPIEYIGQFPTIPLHSRQVPESSLIIKRVLDSWISAVLLVAVAPILVVIAIAIKLDSKGPVFYRSERIGKKGRVFGCFKFRTMVADAESLRAAVVHMNERDGVLFKIANDPRITRVGRLLRKYSFDELPQFFNVLMGDMSIVGPRPPLASEVKKYKVSHLRRLSVTPGITGLWQVQGRQDPSFDSYVSLDLSYIENWSLWLDIKIMIRTVGVILAGTGM